MVKNIINNNTSTVGVNHLRLKLKKNTMIIEVRPIGLPTAENKQIDEIMYSRQIHRQRFALNIEHCLWLLFLRFKDLKY